MRPRRPIACALLTAAALMGACASSPDARTQPRTTPQLGLDVGRSASIDGIELRWWAADDNDNAVAAALASLAEPTAVLPPDLQTRWNESGLRLVRLPREALPDLRRAAPPASQFSRDWKGWMGQWLPVFRGGVINRPTPFIIDARPRLLGPGAPRILMRAWPAPTALGPVVRADFAFQFIQDGPGASASADLVPTATPPVRAGEIINELTAELALDPTFVYVLTCEAPGVDWFSPETSAAASSEPAPGPSAAGGGRPATIGELLFAFTLAERSQKRRVIVVIVPELKSDFALLPRTDPGEGQ